MVQMEGAAGRRRGVVGGARAHSTDFRTRERQQHFDRRTTEQSLGLGIIILYYFANLPEESMDCAKPSSSLVGRTRSACSGESSEIKWLSLLGWLRVCDRCVRRGK